MNKTVILNLSWLAIGVAAFVLGRTSVTASSDSAEGSSLTTKSSSSSGRSGSGPSGSSADGSRSGTRGDRSAPSGSGGSSGVTVAQFLRENDSLVANRMFADLLLELSAENAAEIFDTLLANRVDPQRVGLFLEAWGKLDGPAAMQSVANLEGDGRRRAMAALAVISGWAAVDPDAAKAHIAGAEEGWEKGMLSQGIVSGLAKSDPLAATNYVLELEAAQRAQAANGQANANQGDERWRGWAYDRHIDAIANEVLRRGTADATAWAESLPEGEIKAAAFDRVAERLATDDPEAAAEWIQSHAGNEYADRGVREVAEELARKDPAAAVTWIERLPAASQTTAMAETVNRWTREDPVAAGEYLTAMPQSPVRDAAVSSFARELDREEPQVAVQWANSISNPEIRTETLSSVARSWLRTNPEAATQWLPNSGLSAEAQQRALQDAQREGERGGDRRGR